MRILMTGCSSGFGATVRKKLMEQGHRVLGVGLGGPDIEWDFRQKVGVEIWVHKLLSDYGPFDCLISNAGMSHIDFLEKHGSDQFMDVLNVNLVAPYTFTRCFVMSLPTGQPAKVIYTTSMGAVQGLTGSPGYCASKAGLEAMIRTLSREAAGRQLPVGFYGIAPGIVEGTKLNDYVIERLQSVRGMTKEEAIKYSRSMSPLGRPCTHEEVWNLFDYVVNKASMYETGSIYRMPGGAGI